MAIQTLPKKDTIGGEREWFLGERKCLNIRHSGRVCVPGPRLERYEFTY